MGKNKRKFNSVARQVTETISSNPYSDQISSECYNDGYQKYDESNAFVLPSKKRKTEVKKPNVQVKKVLSKKQRKQLEAVIQRKKKKENRAGLLEALEKVQASPKLLSQLTPISEVQTKGLKRFLNEDKMEINFINEDSKKLGKVRISSIKGCKKQIHPQRIKSYDPNIVGFESSEDSSSDDDDDDDNIADPETSPTVKEASENITEKDNIVENKNIIARSDENIDEPTLHFNTENIEDNTKLTAVTITNLNGKNNLTGRSKNFEEIILDSDDDCDIDNDKIEKISGSSNTVVHRSVFVPVERKPEIQKSRLQLPIIGEEQVIVECIKENQIVIITGETGSGKTTQVPQFLYEAGYALNGQMIGITEPRRVAAVSMSLRVAEELNLSSDEVSYLIRFEGNAGENTKIKFMTDGVLLKEIQKDFLLSKYSAIILDEVHERSIYTDILIGLLSRIIPQRCKRNKPMRLIIMSATLQIDDYKNNTALFKIPPPIISIESRQYPVTVHFSKTTATDYISAALKKVQKIHLSLPEGGILVFVTGQQEVNLLVKKLRNIFSPSYSDSNWKKEKNTNLLKDGTGEDKDEVDETSGNVNNISVDDRLENTKSSELALDYCLNMYGVKDVNPIDDADCDLLDDVDSDSDFIDTEEMQMVSKLRDLPKMWVLPLYSLLTSNEQAKVFKVPPPNYRLCVVATNIAETSITIPNIKYVVDTGRTKTKLYDKYTGISMYEIMWASKASANQRAGRAGRTMPGHCYRLYSSAVFNDQFEQWSTPEIKRKPIDELVLQMKCLGIDHIKNFPFPCSPGKDQLEAAEHRLEALGALYRPSDSVKGEDFTKLTSLGVSMAEFPVAPRFAKMLCYSHQHDLLPQVILIVAALAVPQVFQLKKLHKMWKKSIDPGDRLLLGDVCVLYNAVSFIEKCIHEKRDNIEKFCDRLGIRYKAVREVSKLRIQLTKTINANIESIQVPLIPYMAIPSKMQSYQLRQIILMGMTDKVARKLDEQELKEAGIPKKKAAYKIMDVDDIAFLHSSSILFDEKPDWIVYQEAFQQDDKLYVRGITAIKPEWLPVLAPHLCYIPKEYNEQDMLYDSKNHKVVRIVNCTFGRAGWQLPTVALPCSFSKETCRVFAMFLLEGKICAKLKKYVTFLLFTPDTVLKSWSGLISPVKELLNPLLREQIYDKQTLFSHWKTQPEFLLNAYLEWLPKSTHEEIKKTWPPI